MFSGIVEEMGIITCVDHAGDKSVITVQVNNCFDDVMIGDSVAINGVCLTVVNCAQAQFVFEAMPETLRLTSLGSLSCGDTVNVERSVKASTRIGGHFVQGHIDGTATIISIEEDGCALKIWFKKPELYKECFIPKGFIAIDGMSLTLVDVTVDAFSICFIPHTQHVTIVQRYRMGTLVNVEVDHLVKTMALLLQQKEAHYGKY
jgi:riboflavin synthase